MHIDADNPHPLLEWPITSHMTGPTGSEPKVGDRVSIRRNDQIAIVVKLERETGRGFGASGISPAEIGER